METTLRVDTAWGFGGSCYGVGLGRFADGEDCVVVGTVEEDNGQG